LIDDAIKALENQASSSNVKILTDYDKNTPKIRAANLYQVFFNLIKNSIDAMETGGQLHITTKLENNDTLLITFKDTGPGFDQQNAQAIFEPFFTTKTKGKGTGLGLAICKDIIEKYSGTINAQNCPDAGCVFSIKLPLDQNNYL